MCSLDAGVELPKRSIFLSDGQKHIKEKNPPNPPPRAVPHQPLVFRIKKMIKEKDVGC